MIVKTLFEFEGRFALGEVEVKTLPGVPLLHVVGLPDTHIKECGLRLKSALKSCGFAWPRGNQIVVNLRPSYFRKSSSGADLAIALGFLALTGQLSEAVRARLDRCVVYGEVGLDGRVFAPPDLPSAIRSSAQFPVLTGAAGERIRDGSWLEISSLSDAEVKTVSRHFDWENFWRRPSFDNLQFHQRAADGLILAAVGNLNVLLAGTQGSGKTTWARALYALSAPPVTAQICELEDMFGDGVLESRWRPFESPHHSITTQAMIGGGSPIFPGVISRAHGGLLVMDEFLEYQPSVLEALREPVESGYIVQARRGDRLRFPANFQLIATSNLCPCGKLNPVPNETTGRYCKVGLTRCSSVLKRLSGPIMDRFDFVQVTNDWLHSGDRVSWLKIRETVDAARAFRLQRGPSKDVLPDWMRDLGHSHRRSQSLLRVARVLADLRESPAIESPDFQQAYERVVDPMVALRQYFA